MVVANGHPDFHQMGYLASGLCCIEELEGLSAQPAARLGNALDIFGVTTDIARTVDLLSSSSEDGQKASTSGIGGLLGTTVAKKFKLQICPSLLLLSTLW